MRVLVAGIIARYPLGGVAWCSLMYLLGLRRLGHEVHYVEDTGECIYDPEQNAIVLDSTYGLRYIHACLSEYGLHRQWTFIDYRGEYYGTTRARLVEFCTGADLFIDLSGGCWFWRDEYARIPRKILIDTDPAFTQWELGKGDQSLVDFFARFDTLFTFGRNLGAPDCAIPPTPFRWEKTWQPVLCDLWDAGDQRPRDRFTTVMTWRTHSFASADGHKDKELAKMLDLPAMTEQPLELAINGPHHLLRQHGWHVRDGMAASRTPNTYRDYIQRSKAECSVAKHAYVATRSGWFSDRTACYLAAGRPAVVQETGFSKYLPTGEGLLAFRSATEAAEGIRAINADYPRHSRRSREIAREHFDAGVVLPRLLADAHVT